MRRVGGFSIGLLLPLIAIVVFVVLLGFSLLRMAEVENDMRVDAERNMLWVMHQSEVAARRLSEATVKAELGEVDARRVALRLDLLRSRFALLHEGPQLRFVEEIGLDKQLAELSATLAGVTPLEPGFAPEDARAMRTQIAPLAPFFSRAANKAMIREWDNLGGRLETYRTQLQQITASLMGIMVTGGILTVTLAIALRLARRRNQMLWRERDFSALLVSSSGEGILAVDKAGRCTLWNAAMTAMTGRSAERAVGKKLSEIAGFFGVASVRRGVADALHAKPGELPLQPLFREGQEAPLRVDLRFSPVREEGRVVGAIVFVHDASDRYAAMQKEAEDRSRLEHLVTERTRELSDAVRREKSAADLYRNFAGMISHQFRTPLAVADSALQRLIRRGARADTKETAERALRARNAIAGLTRLVQSTLDAARLQAGQTGARREACDLAEILRVVHARQLAATPDARIELEQQPEGEIIALCDPSHAEQVMENLLSNAVKYASAGTAVSVHLHQDAEHVRCDIENHGPPISGKDRKRLFDPDFRGTNSVGTQGTGIGLFIARSLARMQGGDVTLLPGDKATRFRLTLPRTMEAAA